MLIEIILTKNKYLQNYYKCRFVEKNHQRIEERGNNCKVAICTYIAYYYKLYA